MLTANAVDVFFKLLLMFQCVMHIFEGRTTVIQLLFLKPKLFVCCFSIKCSL